MSTLGILAVLVALAFLVETIVEFLFGIIFDKVPALTPYKQYLRYIAVVVGVIGSFTYHFDIIHILSEFAQTDPIIPVTAFGQTLTGIAIGMGSSYLHQFISQFFPQKK